MEHGSYQVIEVMGTSEYSYDDAARCAIARISQQRRGNGWFQVTALRGFLRDGGVVEYQVTLKLALQVPPAKQLHT